MIDTDKYKIEDDVVWTWNDDLDDEGWVLWEYKECPAEKGGYILMDGRKSDKTYEPWNQVLPSLTFQCKIDEKMFAIMDLPLIIQEVKKLREDIEGYQAIWNYLDPKGYAWDEEEFVALIKEHGFETGEEEE